MDGARSAAPAVRLERSVARVLTIGTWVSVGLVLVGVGLMLLGGISPVDAAPRLDLATIPGDIAALRPTGFLWLGILGLLATPSARVVASGIGYARRGERGMVVVSLLILVVVAAGVVAGLTVA